MGYNNTINTYYNQRIVFWYDTSCRTWFASTIDPDGGIIMSPVHDAYRKADILELCAELENDLKTGSCNPEDDNYNETCLEYFSHMYTWANGTEYSTPALVLTAWND
tara:strand:- start:1072 stop:1392 length:321 start_codon:yes stop_codon:yes gene_type:complete